ncbi:DUF1761 family protein [archaeon]|nr:DUF1761 family protein [archaeon]
MIWNILLAGFLASITWFIIGGVLYMNPFVAKMYKSEKSSAVRKMGGKGYMIKMYLFGCLVPSILFAFVFYFVRPSLPGGVLMNTLLFGLLLVAVKIVPRFIDMSLLSTYPRKLLAVDVVNGSIASFVIASVLALML